MMRERRRIFRFGLTQRTPMITMKAIAKRVRLSVYPLSRFCFPDHLPFTDSILTPICSIALWPLFHYLLWQDVATEYASADKYWAPYAATNAIFAKKIAEIYQPGDLIWVHDYHLLLVPKLLRQLIPEAVIGLFVHTPWPSSEVFRCLPRQSACLSLAPFERFPLMTYAI